MAGLSSFHTQLKNIYDQSQMLTSAVISLDKSFETESDRLNRQEAVHHLMMIRTTITGDLERIRNSESTAKYGHTKADAVFSLTGGAIKLLTRALTDNQQTRNFVNNVFSTDTQDKPTFGTIRVCIGPKGLPNDVRAISVSELARKSNRLESEIIRELREKGDLILSEEAFCSLVDKLTGFIQEGHLVLPIPIEKVTELITTSRPEWRAVKPSQTQLNMP